MEKDSIHADAAPGANEGSVTLPEAEGPRAFCDDCGRQYGDEHGFPDLVIPFHIWQRISPTGDDGGLLCPSCICKRLYDAGIREVPGAFLSGPIRSVDYVLMQTLRAVENIEFALEGRRNRWGAALDERIKEGGIAPRKGDRTNNRPTSTSE